MKLVWTEVEEEWNTTIEWSETKVKLYYNRNRKQITWNWKIEEDWSGTEGGI